jgi:hypothetical protein
MRILYLPLVLALLPAPGSAQSLGAAARKEEERRQKNKEKGVKAPLFDDSKIAKKDAASPTPAASPGTAAAGAAPAAPVPATPETSYESGGSDAEAEQRKRQEEMWRSRMIQARARRDTAKRKYDYVSELSLSAGESYVDDDGRVVIRDLDHLREMIAKARAEYEAAEQAIVDLEDSARRAGALPGWLR